MNKVFVDTDVIIDFLIDREPFSTHASEVFNLADLKKISVWVSSLSINNVHYIVRKFFSEKKTRNILGELVRISEIQNVGSEDIENALISEFKDFEDALQHSSALRVDKIQAFITRNIRDFKKSNIPVFTPESFLKAHRTIK